MKMTTTYECEICGEHSNDMDRISECEACGKPDFKKYPVGMIFCNAGEGNYKEMEKKSRIFIGKLSSDGEEIYDKDKVLVKVSANYSINAWKGIVQYNSELCRFEIALLNRTYGKRVFGFDEIEEIYIIKE